MLRLCTTACRILFQILSSGRCNFINFDIVFLFDFVSYKENFTTGVNLHIKTFPLKENLFLEVNCVMLGHFKCKTHWPGAPDSSDEI